MSLKRSQNVTSDKPISNKEVSHIRSTQLHSEKVDKKAAACEKTSFQQRDKKKKMWSRKQMVIIELTRAALISLESPPGNGVNIASATQFANMVARITYSHTVNISLRNIEFNKFNNNIK